MRVIVIGATGTIGSAVVRALESRHHDVVPVSRQRAAERVDLEDPASIRAMYRRVGPVDAVVSVAGRAIFRPLSELVDADFALSLSSKLMGQINLVRLGIASVRDAGSFTLTSGILAHAPSPGSAAISMVNAGVEAFARAAALEMPRGIRINVVSPGWVTETLVAMGRDPSRGTPADVVARWYVDAVAGGFTGAVLTATNP
ncbi:MAG: short chain dehydrogenase [Gemmatimonadota bacterium]